MSRLRTRLSVLGIIAQLAFTGCSSEQERFALDPCDGPGYHTERCGGLVLDEDFYKSDSELRWESRPHLTPDSTFDAEISANVRLALSYDSTTNAFKGTVANRNSDPLLRVRIEVRLDGSADRIANTTLVDLASSQVREVNFPVDGKPFTLWQVLAEVQGLNRIHGHP